MESFGTSDIDNSPIPILDNAERLKTTSIPVLVWRHLGGHSCTTKLHSRKPKGGSSVLCQRGINSEGLRQTSTPNECLMWMTSIIMHHLLFLELECKAAVGRSQPACRNIKILSSSTSGRLKLSQSSSKHTGIQLQRTEIVDHKTVIYKHID
jgi:hypothetical protein